MSHVIQQQGFFGLVFVAVLLCV